MSEVRDPDRDQPLPGPSNRPFVQDMVIADIEERKQHGIRKYGTALQAGNGRDMLQDAYEEAMDLTVYLRGVRDEQDMLKLEIEKLLKERNQLIKTCLTLAASLGWETDGSTNSAIDQISAYVQHLEESRANGTTRDSGGGYLPPPPDPGILHRVSSDVAHWALEDQSAKFRMIALFALLIAGPLVVGVMTR